MKELLLNNLVESWYSTEKIHFLNELFKTLKQEDRAYFLARILDKDETKDVLQDFYLYLYESLSNPKKPVIENFFAFYLKARQVSLQGYFRKKQKWKKSHQSIESDLDAEKKLNSEAEITHTQTALNQKIIKISDEFLQTQLKKIRDQILWQEYAENGLRGGELAKKVNLQLTDNKHSTSAITTQTQRLLDKFIIFAQNKLKLLGEYP